MIRALVCMCLVAIAAVCGALTVIRGRSSLPAPSGAYAVGTTSATIERAGSGSYDVQIWYPARPSADRSPYVTGGRGIKDRVIALLLRTRGARDAAPSAGDTRFPIVFYLAGWGGSRFENTALCEDLASHGFAVIALDDVTRETPPPANLNGTLDLRSDEAYASTLALAARKRAYGARRLSDLLSGLLAARGPLHSNLAMRLDPTRVAAVGYSFGGAIAYEAARTDSRFGAAVNLDGWLFADRAEPLGERRIPYLIIGTQDPVPSESDFRSSDPILRYTTILNDDDWRFQRRLLERGGAAVLVAGTTHASFTDDVRYALFGRSKAAIAPDRVARIVSRYSLAFLDRALAINARPAAVSDVAPDPAVKVESWPLAAAHRSRTAPRG